MDISELLRDLYELGKIQGEHNGRWRDEYDREESSSEYLRKVQQMADKYNIKYNDNLDDYTMYDEEEIDYTDDYLGFELLQEIKVYLMKNIKGVI